MANAAQSSEAIEGVNVLVAVNFHYIRPEYDQPYPSIFGVTPEQFSRQLDVLAEVGEFVSTADILSALHGEKPLPDRAWLITFDDGLREQFDHAWPILQSRNIPAILYAITDPIANHRISMVHKIHLVRAYVGPERLLDALGGFANQLDIEMPTIEPALATTTYKYDTVEAAKLKYLLNFALAQTDRDRLMDACFADLLGWDEAAVAKELYMDRSQIRELGVNDYLGSHAHDHLPLGTLPADEIEHQIAASLELLRDWSGTEIQALSYPYGTRDACTPVVGEIAARLGIEFALTMERSGNPDLNTPLFLGRCTTNDAPGGTAALWTPERVFDEIPAATWERAASTKETG